MLVPLLYTLSWPDRIYCSEATLPRLDLAEYYSFSLKAYTFKLLKTFFDFIHQNKGDKSWIWILSCEGSHDMGPTWVVSITWMVNSVECVGPTHSASIFHHITVSTRESAYKSHSPLAFGIHPPVWCIPYI